MLPGEETEMTRVLVAGDRSEPDDTTVTDTGCPVVERLDAPRATLLD
jgi:hypothetical protein